MLWFTASFRLPYFLFSLSLSEICLLSCLNFKSSVLPRTSLSRVESLTHFSDSCDWWCNEGLLLSTDQFFKETLPNSSWLRCN